jgi:hypothetical protein
VTSRAADVVLAFLLLSFVAALARAEQPPRIAALVPSANAAITTRISAELAAAGFQLLLAEPQSWPPSRQEIAEIARREGAIAGLALISNENTIEIWIVDRITGKTVVRALPSKPGAQNQQDQMDLVAICTLETLRATLMEISVPRHTRGELAPPSAVRALVRAGPSRFSLRVAGAVGYGSHEQAAALELGLAGTVAVHPRLRLGLDAFVPLTAPALTGPEGQAELALSLAGAFVEASLTDPSAPADVMLGGGAWLGLLTLRGAAEPPYAESSLQIVTLMPHLDLGARARLSRGIAVLARGSGALAIPKANVRFAGRDVASWGLPFVLGAVMFEVGLD